MMNTVHAEAPLNNPQLPTEATEINTLDDIEALEAEYPLKDVKLPESTYARIKESAETWPNATAISFILDANKYAKSVDITYTELLENVTRAANFFHDIGLTENDTIAFVLPNLPETHYVIWGGQTAATVLAINPLLEPKQIGQLIDNAKAKAVVTMNPFPGIDLWKKVEEALPLMPNVQHLIGVDIAQHVSGAKGFIARLLQRKHRSGIILNGLAKYHNFTASLKGQNKQALNFKRTFTKDTLSSMFCTGGTTGLPKIARRTHQNELINAYSIKMMNQANLAPGKVILGGLPLFHVNGALVTGLGAFAVGAKVVIATPQGYRGDNVIQNFWHIVEHYKVNTFSGVPTVYAALLNVPTEGRDVSSLEMCICGAAPMPVEIFKTFQEKLDVRILEGYGLTEGTCVSSLTPMGGEQKIGSIGLRIPYQQMLTVRLEDDQIVGECDTNEIGALVMRGPNVFAGYQLEEQNKGLWVVDDQGNKWLNSGDLARRDEDNYFWLTGRKKELIVRGGHNIEPKIIEEAMCRHPAIDMAAAVGMPDAHAGEVPVCYVQIDQANAQTITELELMNFASKEIPERAAIPKAIHIIEELPLTAVGKVFKPELEMREIKAATLKEIETLNLPTDTEVSVRQDSKYGIITAIDAKNLSENEVEALSKTLGSYTFKYEFV